jgi:hypothetical protein
MALNPALPVVAPNELITSTHMNNVRANLDRLDTTKLALSGATDQTVVGNVTTTGAIYTGNVPTASNDGCQVRADGNIWSVVVGGGANPAALPNLALTRTNSPAMDGGGVFASFRRTSADTVIGTITIATATTVAYNQSSDPRLKHRDGDAADAAAMVQDLGHAAFRGRWLDDDGEPAGEEWVLLSSHDIEDVAPFAVTGARDAVTDTGGIDPQQVNYPALVPLLCAALANALDRLDQLEGTR